MSSKKNSNKYGIIEKHKSKSSWFLILFIITFMMSIF